MKLSLLFGILPTHMYDTMVQQSKGSVQYAADALQKSLIDGLCAYCEDVNLFNLPYIGSYPSRYSSVYIESSKYEYQTTNGIVNSQNVGFCNLIGYKLWSRYFNARKALLSAYKRNQLGDVLLVYAIHTPFLKAAIEIKKKCPSLKVVLIVPDLPEYMASQRYSLGTIFLNINQSLLHKLYKDIDAFVLLSDHMRERLPVHERPFTIVEGIYNPADTPNDIILSNKGGKRYILYTGTLARRYGVLNLVNAFMKIKNPDVELVICGEGDAKADILDLSKKDSRIQFKGLLVRSEVLTLQMGATLLVNPRTPEGEFTKYSFPSKTMEYLASGVPTLLYRLPGIPDEYYGYCFSLTDISVDALAAKMESILKMSREQLNEIGKNARNFIYTHKSPKMQAMKIIEMIQQLN